MNIERPQNVQQALPSSPIVHNIRTEALGSTSSESETDNVSKFKKYTVMHYT